ncbi:unnamed protein product [Parnassius mnemosyne]|uniref:Integrase catalytic domain-containing protein n=1 Tax=Parnassius mnemosyne TaxID=213953 RepID=A0AAV1LYX2_9NEOP
MSSIVAYSEKDQEIYKVKKGVYKNDWDDLIKSYKFFENELCFHGSILLRGNKIVIPQQLCKSVLDAAYEGHPGIVAMKGRLRSKIIKIVKEMFSRLGYPISITADNGKQFVSEEFRSFCKECNIKLFSTVPYWPQMIGEVERQNRDILKRLHISQIERKDLKEFLWEYLLMYNSTLPYSYRKVTV